MMAGTASPVDQDVLIVGAGISGIGMAVHLQMHCPDRSFALAERRANLGGTWDLFRYPGIRSDSDMHTLGFVFEPWKHEKSIADGPSILEYLNRIVDERGIRDKIRFNAKVVGADWDSATARWTVTMEDEKGATSTTTARWLYLGSGYYDYDEPFDAQFAGREDFQGQIVHPQFWPKDLDYAGKKVVVIGSGATAVTIVPSMTEKGDGKGAAHVTMLQRTPTWYAIRPAKDAFANFLRKVLPSELAYKITRFKNVKMQDIVFNKARTKPEKVREFLTKQLQKNLGDKYDPEAFTPPYNPWEQRLCLVPDADFFEAMKADKASVVTDHIERFDATGIQLKSGKHLDADIIVTATGLKLAVAGKIPVRVDGETIQWNEHFYYKACMFSNVPNFSVVFGYLNASWTLRADIVSEYVCRVLNHMKAAGADIATPVLEDPNSLTEENIFDFSSGYIQRSLHIMPKNADALPWRLNQHYVKDRVDMRTGEIADGVLTFTKAGAVATAATAAAELEAAE
ncbi:MULTISPECIES: NAD(P)/FAD-dependent oxidoreductase [unclassified Sphingopyxis]|uniref:flavin-containing monooxygenase n=1 Tax=unclassified Sphingopyxis TaxID=2614943 RepID=UPI00073072C3|nr:MULTISPECIES: NAD(P)/FAD-dependent oxidoreductase [unclassified Sphingopyxis]KTE26487.1 FAD-containing monooxygenase EthA [Sphingopyxis sp. H057]KTE52892.1 FAD-containing monooxygenase EthA [Sphingopyxis sp. H073]KTE55082.1 FAD-containing monooxygenase EthA [Sphingopyxis sp. H071]KTE59364.1 FAD-containing monooxygenase EthA [Sphingopyxis sp. H107]KTE64164.1 FAD-containing monooxygenase EthA [Sphingopyxis sp. H100]